MTWNGTAQAHLDAGNPARIEYLLTTTVAPIAGGAAVNLGFWTGGDHQSFTVDGVTLTYSGAQGAMAPAAFRYAAGTDILSQDITMALSPEGETLARAYRLSGAPCKIHGVLLDGDTGALLDTRRFFIGTVESSDINMDPAGGFARLDLRLFSSARRGTFTRSGKKSDASQSLRSGDRFRRYGDLGRVTADPWGQLS